MKGIFAKIKTFFSRLGARIADSIRKGVVSLKRSPSTIPLVMLMITFLYYSLNLTDVSDTTAKIQGVGMGLCQFAIMLLSMLSIVCLLNSFPKRKKANVPMVVLTFIMFAVMAYCAIHYIGRIDAALNRAEGAVVINDSTAYILVAKSMLKTFIALLGIDAALIALLPVYSKLLKKINTSVEVEDNGSMDEIEISE